MFLFTTLYPFFSPNYERAKVNTCVAVRDILFFIFVNRQCNNGHGVVILGAVDNTLVAQYRGKGNL